MCEPISATTLALIAAGTAAAGTAVTAVQASSQAKYQAKVADRNATLENEAAENAERNTRTEALAHYRRIAQLRGQQRVAAAANGVAVDFGSSADVAADTALLGREDVGRIYSQGDQTARGFEINAANYRSEASAKRQAATGALVGGAFDVASTALAGAQQYQTMTRSRSGSSTRRNYGVGGR